MLKQTNTIIVDDEQPAIDSLKILLKDFHDLKVIETFRDSLNALDFVLRNHPGLIFLDIKMPDLSGIEFAKKLMEKKIYIPIIFTTAHDEFILDALRNNAVDYLLKPVGVSDLKNAIERLYRKTENEIITQLENLIAANNRKKLRYNTRTGFITFFEDEVLYVQAEGNYSKIILKNGKKIIVSFNLGKVEEQLTLPQLVKIHRSYIINSDYVYEVHRGKKKCVLIWDGQNIQLPISSNGITLLDSLVDNEH